MNITTEHLEPTNEELRNLLTEAAEAHMETGRRAVVVLRLVIRKTKEGKRELTARAQATLPEGAEDSRTKKGEPLVLISMSDDHPGQQRIET